MIKVATSSRETRDLNSLLRASKGELLPYRQVFELIRQTMGASEGLLVTTLPRGSLQIAQPLRVPESLLRSYSRRAHLEDRLSWQAILHRRGVSARDVWGDDNFQASDFYKELLEPHGFRSAAAAALESPMLAGYPGALQVYRNESAGPFSDTDVSRLETIASLLNEAIAHARDARRGGRSQAPGMAHLPHQFIFDADLRMQLPTQGDVPERLRARMIDYARFRLSHVNSKAVESDRVSLPDERGDLLHFRVVVHKAYPALGSGPFVFFCLQPACTEWSTLRPGDFQADPDVSRLVPAIRFMRDHFQRGPTLGEISRAVHLSPFHFHRRFTEVFGITPKHFMLDCQIEHAKSELLARQKDLSDIASACGFAHQSHFTSRFKQATGFTPTRWRRMVAKLDERRVARD